MVISCFCVLSYRVLVIAPGIAQGWTPVPLRIWFWVPLVVFMILLAIGLEIALHFSNKQQGRLSTPCITFPFQSHNGAF